MRRKIELYIGGRLADLDGDSFILFNYTMDDLRNPTIVKNAFSKQVSLKGTPANNAIFGHYFRLDRKTDRESATAFNASIRTPFAIYDEAGVVLESGYCRLDKIDRKGADITYKVTLFGGLGSFFYSLSYAGSGEKLTLADLDYLGTADPVHELDFAIYNTAVTNAWNHLAENPASIQQIWDVINFAPAYNGLPDGDFTPDKAIVTPSQAFLADTQEDYTAQDGKTIVNLARPHTEWEMKDLRSYLQRPVLSMRAFLEAVARPQNNGGYTFDYSTLPLAVYSRLWKTLPSLPSLGGFKQAAKAVTLTPSSAAYTTSEVVSTITPTYDGTTLDTTLLTARYELRFAKPSGAPSGATWRTYYHNTSDPLRWLMFNTAVFIQLVAYDNNGNAVGGSPVRCICAKSGSVQDLADQGHFTPFYARAGYEEQRVYPSGYADGSGYWSLGTQTFQCEAPAPYIYKLHIATRWLIDIESNSPFHGDEWGPTADTERTPFFWTTAGQEYQATGTEAVYASGEVTIQGGNSIRSYSRITKQMLLSGSGTPADYLIGMAKMHGLVFTYDRSTQRVDMLTRNAFYDGSSIIDLSGLVDTSKGLEITPLAFTAKWYDLDTENVGGAFADEYKSIYGINFGIQRVDTGYSFDASSEDLLAGLVYKGAVSVLESGRYFNYFTVVVDNETKPFPSVFQDYGNTYTLWNEDGEAKEFPCPLVPAAATKIEFNTNFPGYDADDSWKLQLHGADGKPVDGRDVLVYFKDYNISSYFRISDDSALMLSLNDGKGCWDMTPGPSAGIYIPLFNRYQAYHSASPAYEVGRSLDFGTPKEIDIPRIDFRGRFGTGGDCTLYERAWQSYIRDRYDMDTKVLKCYVDLSGFQVGEQLLRRFYYFDGCYWTLNKIINHSLTTWDTTECEFVQVKDISAYTNGQNL